VTSHVGFLSFKVLGRSDRNVPVVAVAARNAVDPDLSVGAGAFLHFALQLEVGNLGLDFLTAEKIGELDRRRAAGEALCNSAISSRDHGVSLLAFITRFPHRTAASPASPGSSP
jgi:hypothetical protein